MTLLLYATTAAALLWLCHRAVRPLSRPAALILLLLPFCFVGYALVTGRAYGPFDFAYATEPLQPMRGLYGIGPSYNGILSDVACQMIPWRKAVQWSLAHGEWPLLNRFILSGDILAAAAQPAVYSPFTLLALLLPVALSMTFTAAIAFFVAALSTFLFARDLDCSEPSALFGSAAFMYSTAMAFFIEWPLAFSWAFLPLVLLGVRRVIRAQIIAFRPELEEKAPERFRAGRSIALLTIAFVLLLLAGHPETALHVVFVGAVYGLFEMAVHRRAVLRSIVAASAAGVMALLICAIYVLPIIEAAAQTAEQAYRKEHYATAVLALPIRDMLARIGTDLFPFLHVRQWLVEGLIPPSIDSAAVGSIALAAAVFAVWRIRSRYTWFFTGLAIFGLLARAMWGPLMTALQKLPLFDITLNERFSYAAAFSLAILGALGVEELLRRRAIGAAATFAIVLAVLAAGTLLILRANIVRPDLEMWGEFKIFAELGLLSLATFAVLPSTRNRYTAAIVLGLILLQRTMSESGVYSSFPKDAAYPPVPIFEPLKNVREPFRVTGFYLTFIPGTSALYELEDVRGYEAMTLKRYADTYRLWCVPQAIWFNRIDDLTKPFLSFLNVRYSVMWGHGDLPDGWREVARQRGARLIENTRAIERAFVPAFVRLGISDPDALNQMAGQTDFRQRAWIQASLEPHERPNGPGRVSIRPRRLGYELTADMDDAGWIVISEAAWKGWRAYIDGRRVKMQIANTAFLSVYVPQGHHKVRLTYLPQSFVVGRMITFLTLAAIGMALAVRRLRR